MLRTRDDITDNTLMMITTVVGRIADIYQRNHRGYFSKKPLARALENLQNQVNGIRIKQVARVNESDQFTRFKKFVGIMQSLQNFLLNHPAAEHDFSFHEIKKLLFTEIFLQKEVPLSKRANSVDTEIARALRYLDLLTTFPTTTKEDVLFAIKWNVEVSQHGANDYPLWNAFREEIKSIFAGSHTRAYLQRILAGFDDITGLHPNTTNLNEQDAGYSQTMSQTRENPHDITPEMIKAFKKELNIFTKANIVKLLTDCLIEQCEKVKRYDEEVDPVWLTEHILKPFLERLDELEKCYHSANILDALQTSNSHFKTTTALTTENDYAALILNSNIQTIRNHQGPHEYAYDPTSGALVYAKKSCDEMIAAATVADAIDAATIGASASSNIINAQSTPPYQPGLFRAKSMLVYRRHQPESTYSFKDTQRANSLGLTRRSKSG